MNKVKRTARKRHLRQTVNKVKLEGKEVLPNLRNRHPEWGGFTKDQKFMVEVSAKQKPYFTTTAFRARLRGILGLPVFGEPNMS